MADFHDEVPEVDIAGLVAAMAGGAALVDVRSEEEYAAGHVPGARSLPMTGDAGQSETLPEASPLYVICQVGGRSYRAAELFRRSGIDAINVAGGTNAWADAGHPVNEGMEP